MSTPPKLTTLYIRSCAIGFGAAAVFVALLLWMNVANLGHLILNSQDGLLALAILWIANGIVFAGVQFGVAVMSWRTDGSDGDSGRRAPARPLMRSPSPRAATVPIPANEGTR